MQKKNYKLFKTLNLFKGTCVSYQLVTSRYRYRSKNFIILYVFKINNVLFVYFILVNSYLPDVYIY